MWLWEIYAYLEILTDLYISPQSDYEAVAFRKPSVCLPVYMDVRLVIAWLAGRILFIIDFYEFIHHRSVSGEYKHSSLKIMGPWIDLPKQYGDSLDSVYNNFDQISVIYGGHLP